ncbi:MAG: GyrI-like domain-containing protein [Roseivirga sp.]|nr:GyrI-like domain-containing protein [Roseivirga sp.]
MNYQIRKRKLIQIIGMEVRTTFVNNQQREDINKLWQRMFAEGVLQKIPNKRSEIVFNLYCDYEDKMNGAVTVIVGCEVDSLDHVPDGLSGRAFEAYREAHVKVKGKLPEVVYQAWEQVEADGEIKRSYMVDSELPNWCTKPGSK